MFSSSFFLAIFKETNNNSNNAETEKYWQQAEAAMVTVLNTILAKLNRNWNANFKPVRGKLLHFILMIPFLFHVKSYLFESPLFIWALWIMVWFLIPTWSFFLKLTWSYWSLGCEACSHVPQGIWFLLLLVKETRLYSDLTAPEKDCSTQRDIPMECSKTDSKKL